MNLLKLSIASALFMSASAFANTYKVDTKESSIKWVGTKITGDSHHGTVAIKDGSIEVTDGKVVGGNFVADMKSLNNEDLAASPGFHEKLVGHLKSEDFFNVEKYPEATFKITEVQSKSATEALVKGDMTFIGKTEKIEFPAQIDLKTDVVSGTAKLKLDRTKWNLKYGSGKFFKNLGDKVIKDEFELDLKIVAKGEAKAKAKSKK